MPARLQALAEIQAGQGKYFEADRVYDRAEAFIDSPIGSYSTVLEKTALIAASSSIYSRHFSLVAERFRDAGRTYSIIEQVCASDCRFADGRLSDVRRGEDGRTRYRLKLMTARSTADLQRLRDQIFMAEQSRWITPEVSIL